MKTRNLLAVVFSVLSLQLSAQKTEFVRPSEIFEQVEVLADSGRYADAISLLKKIPDRDTAYAAARLKMAYGYISNEQPDSAIRVCDQLLRESSTQRVEYLRLKGLSMASVDYKKGTEFLEDVTKQYPTIVGVRYSLAAVHFDNKQYEKAAQHCFRILEINPYHPSAHKLLGRIAILQGHKTHGMMALGMYLGVSPRDNAILVLLNQLADNQIKDEGTYTAFSTNSASRLDQMIRAKLVMGDGFKSAFPFSAPVVRQFELIFDQLDKLTVNPGDQYLKHYLPLYQTIKSKNQLEPFIYHLLTSTTIEGTEKWRNKNEKVLSEFYSSTNTALAANRSNQVFPEFGFTEKTNTWFDNSNRITAIGNVENEKRVGRWLHLHINGEKSAEGMYNAAGKKVGIWKYYRDNGKAKSVENMDTGEVTVYSEKEVKAEHFFLKDDKIDGQAETFYRNGERNSLIPYVAGVREGKQTDYHENGVVGATYSYVQGKINGPYEFFHPNGKLRIRATFKDDYYNGKYEEYYSNGALSSTGQYSAGQPVGEWKYYYRNGKLSYGGMYTPKGNATGEWTYYDYTGMMTEKRRFDSEGRYDGESIEYEDGKQKYLWVYKKGSCIKHTSFSPEGKVIFSAGNNNGTFYAKVYSSDGVLLREGNYVQGKIDGLWKYYTRYGKITREYHYMDNQLHGSAIDYFVTGAKQVEVNFEAGEQNGKFVRYLRSGVVEQEGWYDAGTPEQQWLSYYPDGSLRSDDYFIGGKETGYSDHYAVDGKLYLKVFHDGEAIDHQMFYNSRGNEASVRRMDGAKEIYEQFFSNKKVSVSDELLAGNYFNHRKAYFPDGSVLYDYEMLNDLRHGKYLYNHPNGKLFIRGQNEDGEKTGLWETYHMNGKLSSVGRYFEGQEDSVWTFYHDNGLISSRGPWKAGEKHGAFVYYNEEGNPVLEKRYVHDELVSYRSLTGTTPGEWVTFTGTQKIEVTYPDGKPAWYQEYKDGRSHGVQREYNSKGVVYEESRFLHGERDGDQKLFYPNGKLKLLEQFKENDAHGAEEYYDENGALVYSAQYRFGHQHGKFLQYEKGKKIKEFNFWYGNVE
jgi:antitoxin component YwqK of YwqJK toxin-antitoxin module